MKQQIVKIDSLDQLVAAIMLYDSQRASRGGPVRHKQRVERSRKRANVVGAGICDVPYFVDPNGSEPRKRDIRRHVAKFRSENLLQTLLDFRQALATDQHRADLGQADATLPVHCAIEALRYATPHVDGQTIAGAHHVIWSRRKIHGYGSRIADALFKYIDSKSSGRRWPEVRLHVHVVERRNIFVRIRGANQLSRLSLNPQITPIRRVRLIGHYLRIAGGGHVRFAVRKRRGLE